MAKPIPLKSSSLILIADDDPSIRLMTRHILERDGHKVIEATDGIEALAIFKQQQPDLVLLDGMMPELDGFETCARLCQLPGGDHVPILMITVLDDGESVSRAFEVGAADYVLKPIHWTVLRRRVRHLLQANQAELALRESEERYRILVETSPDAIALIDLNFNTLFCNHQAVYMHGCDNVTEIIGKSLLDFVSAEDQERVMETVHQSLENNRVENVECMLIKRKGGYFLAELSISKLTNGVGKTEGFVIVTRDISEPKRVEAEMKQRNRELTLLNQIIATSAASLEPEGVLDIICRELALAFDIPRVTAGLFNETKIELRVVAEYLAQVGPSLLNSRMPVATSPLAQILLTHQAPLVAPNVQSDARLVRIHEFLHEHNTVSLMILPLVVDEQVLGGLYLESDKPHHFSPEEVSLAWNVVDQVAGVLVRASLTQMRQRLSAAVEQTAESIVITDIRGLITYVNPAFERTSGYSQSEVIGQNPRLLKSEARQADFYRQLWDTISAGQVWHGRFVNKSKDGVLYTVEATITPVLAENREIINYIGILRDVTHQLQLEEQLRQSKKMEAIGRLAGGIAHDFNNLLTVINGYSELLLARRHELPEKAHYELEQIKKAGQRATALTQQLLAFSRKQPLQPRTLNLNAVVTNTHQLLDRLIGEDLKLSLNLEPDLAQIIADPSQLEQIIINLAVNARDAMPQGGELMIETNNVTLDEAYARQHAEVTPGPYILLAVSDTGTGMDAETLAHIFEPFFTTKEQGKGTGLGLAIVHSIIKQNNGHIRVESAPGQGSAFKIFLPPAKALPESLLPNIIPSHLARGWETILVVEDEVSVREIICNILEANGYTVLQAPGGSEALQLCQEQQPEPLHLLFTDVVMLGMNGEELATHLTQKYPHLKVLYTSGYGANYARNVLIQHNLLEPSFNFLEKPFTPDALLRQVRETLDRGQIIVNCEL